ncbi:MAG: hypothetical protein ACRDXX_18150 [Stackebrandtia sp.]
MTYPPHEPSAKPGAADQLESYPDPKRSWRRAGALLAGWAATWAAVAVMGMSWKAVADAGEESVLDEPPASAQQAVGRFFTKIFEDRDLNAAKEVACPDYTEPSVEDLYAVLDDWEQENGEKSGNRSLDIKPVDGDAGKFTVTVTYGSSDNPQLRRYEASSVSADEEYCVSAVEDVTPDPSDEPDPSEDPEPIRGAKDTAEGFFEAVFNGEDPKDWQCADYSGLEPDELLPEGEGDPSLSLDPRESDFSDADRFFVEISLRGDSSQAAEYTIDIRVGIEEPCVLATATAAD